jgi:cytochrome b subunit of formate dehydrogenase
MQQAEMVHSVVAMLFIAVMLAHIYMGTIGMEGAFEPMGSGTSISIESKNTTPCGSRKALTGRRIPRSPSRPQWRGNSCGAFVTPHAGSTG